MRQTTAASPIAMAREHTAGDRRAADDARRIAPDDEPRPTDGVEATRIRRLAADARRTTARRRAGRDPNGLNARRGRSASTVGEELEQVELGHDARRTAAADHEQGRRVRRTAARTPRRPSRPTSSVGSGRSMTSPIVRSTTSGLRYARSSRLFSLDRADDPREVRPVGRAPTPAAG